MSAVPPMASTAAAAGSSRLKMSSSWLRRTSSFLAVFSMRACCSKFSAADGE
jgi:hypothetical protein